MAVKFPDPKTSTSNVIKKRVSKVVELFEEEKGPLFWPGPRDPLTGIIQTLLTHNTTDANSFPAFDNMKKIFPTWEELHNANLKDVADSIKKAGLQNQKADRIQSVLAFVKERYGEYSADALKEMDFDEAFATFSHLNGVKHKTLAVVMSFDLGIDVFPVDTHVHRLCMRLGFLPEKATPVKTFNTMRPLIPEGKSYQFHIHLIRYGRSVCMARKPDCNNCFVSSECLFFHNSK
jgi:endonuclease III